MPLNKDGLKAGSTVSFEEIKRIENERRLKDGRPKGKEATSKTVKSKILSVANSKES